MTYSKLKAIPCSFFSRDLYRDIRMRWEGIGFSYLFILMALLIIPAVASLMVALHVVLFKDTVNGQSLAMFYTTMIAEQLPPMTWEDGELSIEGEQPYIISVAAKPDGPATPLAIIDLDADMRTLRDSDAMFLLTKEAVHSKRDDSIETNYWDEIEQETFYLDRTVARELLDEAANWAEANQVGVYLSLSLFLWAILTFFIYIYRLFQALIYGGVAMIICSFMRVQMSYQTGVRLACVAMTPAILLDAVFIVAGLGGLSVLMSIALTCGYLAFAVHSTKDIPPRL